VFSAHLSYPDGECTRYCADNWTATVGPVWGDAHRWLASAIDAGYRISSTPRVGAIAVWAPGRGGAHAAGHVALVTGLAPLTVIESNWQFSLRVDSRFVGPDSLAGIAGYILPELVEDPMSTVDRGDLAAGTVISLYATVLHRDADADPAGRDFWWTQFMNHGWGAATRAFLANPESRADIAAEAAEGNVHAP
jgi:surface antigen